MEVFGAVDETERNRGKKGRAPGREYEEKEEDGYAAEKKQSVEKLASSAKSGLWTRLKAAKS